MSSRRLQRLRELVQGRLHLAAADGANASAHDLGDIGAGVEAQSQHRAGEGRQPEE